MAELYFDACIFRFCIVGVTSSLMCGKFLQNSLMHGAQEVHPLMHAHTNGTNLQRKHALAPVVPESLPMGGQSVG